MIRARTSLDRAEEADDESEDCIAELSDKPDDPGGDLAAGRSSSNSSDSGKGSILESTSDFIPTGGGDPDTVGISGIVQQRLKEFQKIQEATQPVPPSPDLYRSRTVVRSGGKLLLFPSYSDRTRKHCCALARDEKFCNLVMKKGFVKAAVEQINVGDGYKSEDKFSEKGPSSVKDLLSKFENRHGGSSNSLKPGDEGNKVLKNKKASRTPQASPRIKRDKNVNSFDYPDNSARNSLRSSEFGGTYSDTLSCAQTEAESGIASDGSTVGFSSTNVVEALFDSSWSDSDMSFDEYSDWDSDYENEEEQEEEVDKVDNPHIV